MSHGDAWRELLAELSGTPNTSCGDGFTPCWLLENKSFWGKLGFLAVPTVPCESLHHHHARCFSGFQGCQHRTASAKLFPALSAHLPCACSPWAANPEASQGFVAGEGRHTALPSSLAPPSPLAWHLHLTQNPQIQDNSWFMTALFTCTAILTDYFPCFYHLKYDALNGLILIV